MLDFASLDNLLLFFTSSNYHVVYLKFNQNSPVSKYEVSTVVRDMVPSPRSNNIGFKTFKQTDGSLSFDLNVCERKFSKL